MIAAVATGVSPHMKACAEAETIKERAAIEVDRRGGMVEARFHLIDHPVTLDRARHIRFGLVPTPTKPVRCIEVGSPDGTFLITRSFIPTHNSSLGRLGLIVHATAGFCDPGWKGTLTLELNNLTRVPIKLYAGLPIAQLSFMTLDAPALRPYGHEQLGSHYQGQVEATESRYGDADRARSR